MALRNGSSQTLGLLDVESCWEAFEQVNRVRLSLRLGWSGKGAGAGLSLIGEMWPPEVESGEVQPLGSVSVRCTAREYHSLDTVVFRLLYQMDGLLAELEMQKESATEK